jgi:hypothetical protein
MAEITDNKPVASRKQKVLDRLKGKRPDLDFNDEEALYGAIDDDYAESDEYRKRQDESNKRVTDWLDKDERNASMITGLMNGEDLLSVLIEEYGPDDLIDALNDPANLERIAEKKKAWQEKVDRNKKMDAEAEANLDESIDNLNAVLEEMGMSEDDGNEAFKLWCQVFQDGCVDKITPETWRIFLKGISYDTDVDDAATQGEVRGRNAKIKDLKGKTALQNDNMPPALAGQGGTPDSQEEGTSNLGAFSNVGQPDVYQRGGFKKVKR